MPMFGFALVVCLGAAAFGIDYARAVAMRQMLSTAADAAALAAVARLPDVGAARAIALEYAQKNMPSGEYGEVLAPADIEIGNWDSQTRTFVPSGLSGTAMRVTTRLADSNGNAMRTPFASFIGADSLDISASAVAGRGGPPCAIALDPVSSSSFRLSGSATVEALNCGVQVNSTASQALSVGGGATLEASNICVGGTASGSASPDPVEYCPGQSNPLASLTPPTFGPCEYNNAEYNNSNETLLPGVYCGGLSIGDGSDITLSSGTYVITDGPFFLTGNSSVTGDEVTIFLTGTDAVVNLTSNTTVDLMAPTSGDLAGILIFQDPNSTGTHKWQGQSATNLRGVIYLPAGDLISNNTNAITPEGSCTVLIASTLEFSANSGMSIDISSAECRGALAGPYQRGIVLLE